MNQAAESVVRLKNPEYQNNSTELNRMKKGSEGRKLPFRSFFHSEFILLSLHFTACQKAVNLQKPETGS